MRNKKVIFSVNTQLKKVSGVEKVTMDIHHAIRDDYDAKIVGNIPFSKIPTDLNINSNEYIRFCNPFMFKDSVVFVHERKLLVLFWVLNTFFFQKIEIIYVHHNIFHSLRMFTVIPSTVVSISDRVTANLTDYFKVPKNNIHKIYNCVQDINPVPHKICETNNIIILYPARINDTKRQLEIVSHLSGKINRNVRILFAGTGPLFNQLKSLVKDEPQFDCLGHRKDVHELLQKADYMLLFSKHEGLPITLIEATMCGTPIICNDVGGNTEIAQNGKNAFVVNDWESLIQTINRLDNVTATDYTSMSREGRNIYEKNFRFETFKRAYLDLIDSIL